MTNTVDITNMTDAELDALLGILPHNEEDMTPAISKAYLKGAYHRDVAGLKKQVADGETSPEEAALWMKLQHGVNLTF